MGTQKKKLLETVAAYTFAPVPYDAARARAMEAAKEFVHANIYCALEEFDNGSQIGLEVTSKRSVTLLVAGNVQYFEPKFQIDLTKDLKAQVIEIQGHLVKWSEVDVANERIRHHDSMKGDA